MRNVRELTGLRLEDFRSFRASRGGTPHTQRKEIEHLRAFCAFCMDHDWISKNWAKKSKPPVGGNSVTLPYEPHEVSALLDACDKITNFNETFQERARLRARALILLLLYSGLRISDAIRLERRRRSGKNPDVGDENWSTAVHQAASGLHFCTESSPGRIA